MPDDRTAANATDEGSADKGSGSTEEGEEPAAGVCSVSDIINGRFAETEDVYVVGYIVGYVKTSSMDFCRFSRGDVETNILIADTPIDTFANKCIPVQLTASTVACAKTRDALNLAHNDVLGQKVRLQGDIGRYMKTDCGVLKARNHTFLVNDFDEEEKGNGDGGNDEETTGDDEEATGDGEGVTDDDDGKETTGGDEQEDAATPEEQEWAELERYIYSHGTADAPFTVADFKTAIPEYLSHFGAPEIGHPGMKDVYVCGYIVGYIPNSRIENTVFGNDGASRSNIVIADLPDEQDYNNCIAVELSLGSNRHKEAREALNLADNPENYKKRFIIFGNITDQNGYMGTLGLKSARECMPCDEDYRF